MCEVDRREYYDEPTAPTARGILPTAFAVVRNERGQVLLVQRTDSGDWELPGGRIEVGESASTALIREVSEEASISIEITNVSGVYSNPRHIISYFGNQVYQQLAICFRATAMGDQNPRPDDEETSDARWFEPRATDQVRMHPAMRLRLHHGMTETSETYFD